MPSRTDKLIELVGVSDVGTDDAIKDALNRTAQTLQGLDWFQVPETHRLTSCQPSTRHPRLLNRLAIVRGDGLHPGVPPGGAWPQAAVAHGARGSRDGTLVSRPLTLAGASGGSLRENRWDRISAKAAHSASCGGCQAPAGIPGRRRTSPPPAAPCRLDARDRYG